MTQTYKSVWIEKTDDGITQSIASRNIDALPEHGIMIQVHYSSLNFKDALSASGNKGVTKTLPHQPGIDAAGVVIGTDSDAFAIGDEVIVTGYDLGMNTAGGLGQYIRVPPNWIIKKPSGLTLRQCMLFGTAGLTAQLCMQKLLRMGLSPEQGDVLVTGATGGVGSIAVALLHLRGFKVVASTGKPEQEDYLRRIGADQVMNRSELSQPEKRPLLKTLYAGAIDVAGGTTLSNVLKHIQPAGSVAICGLVESHAFDATVMPFILRGIHLLGVDSVEIPLAEKQQAWEAIAQLKNYEAFEAINHSISLDEVPEQLNKLLEGKGLRHCLVNLHG